ncbi:MAG: TetR/AcrR family transcriptional regulator [Actinomycetota bacterium]
MSPRLQDPQVRTALIDAAARLLIAEGPSALTTRRLADEVGTSTMAVYTYFAGMDDLKRSLRREGFERLAQNLDAVALSDDPVTDVVALGSAYFFNAITNSHLYRFMFLEHAEEEPDVGYSTFERLVTAVGRAVEAGRFEGDPLMLASQLWVMAHGIVTLHIAGLVPLPDAINCLTEMGSNLFVAFGDERETARASIEEVRVRVAGEWGGDAALSSPASSIGSHFSLGTDRPEAGKVPGTQNL